jgi:hypothetical protein
MKKLPYIVVQYVQSSNYQKVYLLIAIVVDKVFSKEPTPTTAKSMQL